ncbi:MAG: alpha/beta hydrolase [Sphingomonas sp. 28-66-16]|nr:MAG: alpha/beta hydrolase [Sphingomonas sp. 28-66-16]
MLRSETAASPARQRLALAGLAAYQNADRGGRRRLGRVRNRRGRAMLRDYGGAGQPVLFIPSLINPPFILDLTRRQSLLRWLAARGVRTLLLDWGTPAAGDHAMDIGDHVDRLLVPLIRKLESPPILVGYCLGGTIAAAAACLTPVAGLAMIAAPWHFAGFGDAARARIAALWARARPVCEAMGLVPMEVLQTGFWQLDPARTIAKYEAFASMPPDSDAARSFVALEDWANAGAPLTFAAGRALFEDFIAEDLPGSGRWRIGDTTIDPFALACPTIDFVSMSDRIVPAASAARFSDCRELGAGHVGMVVGSRARTQLWSPLADWISGVEEAR